MRYSEASTPSPITTVVPGFRNTRTAGYRHRSCFVDVLCRQSARVTAARGHGCRTRQGQGGEREAVLDGVRTPIRPGFAVLVPAGTEHNIINNGRAPLKLYTLYAPPNHRDGTVHHTRDDAEAADEHFDGKTTESELAGARG